MYKLIFKLAFREIRTSWRTAIFFLLNLSLGFSGFVTLQSFNFSLHEYLAQNAQTLLGADIAISQRQVFSKDQINLIRQTMPTNTTESETIEFFAMAINDKTTASQLSLIRVVDDLYPLYGEIRLDQDFKISSSTTKQELMNNGAWVYPELALTLGLQSNEVLQLGEAKFIVKNFIEHDPSKSFRSAAMAPVIIIHRSKLDSTGLIKNGSTLSHFIKYRLNENDNAETLIKKLETKITDPAIDIESAKSAGEDSGRQLKYLSDYLGLVSIIGLLLSFIGAAYVMRDFIQKHLKEIAIYRCLGMQVNQSILVYVTQILILAMASMIPTIVFSSIGLPLFRETISTFSDFNLPSSLNLSACLLSFTLAIVVGIFVALPLLSDLKNIPISQLFSEFGFLSPLKTRMSAYIPMGIFLLVMGIWQAQSIRTGLFFFLGLSVSLILMAILGFFIFQMIPQSQGHWAIKYSLKSLRKNFKSNFSSYLAICFGAILINILPQMLKSLKEEFEFNPNTKLPSLFLFDIQDEQKSDLEKSLSIEGLEFTKILPMVRARIVKVNDQAFERQVPKNGFTTREEERESRFRNRGVNVTYPINLSVEENIVEGRNFETVYSGQGPAEITLEQKYAERLSIKLNDLIQFDIQGVELDGRVVGFRQIQWSSFQPNFFITIQPGVLEDAPKTFVASLPKIPLDKKIVLQNTLAKNFPNVSAIDVERLVKEVLQTAEKMAVSLKFMAWMSVITGLMILVSVLRIQIHSRRREINMLKILGSSRTDLIKFVGIEYLVISGAAAAVGALLSLIVSYLILHFVFNLNLQLDLISLIGSSFIILTLSIGMAILSIKRVLDEKALTLLREIQ